MLLGVLFLVEYWMLGATQVVWALLVTLTLAGLNLVFLRWSGRIGVAGYVSSSLLLTVAVVAVLNTGGFYDPGFSWLFVVPLAAAFLVDLRAMWIFVALVIVVTLVLWWLPEGAVANVVPPDLHSLQSLLNRLAVIIALAVMTTFFILAQKTARDHWLRVNRSLEEEMSARRRTEEALRASEASYRDLVDNSADLIWTHDLEGGVLSVNPTMATLLGRSGSELIGTDLRWVLPREPPERWDEYRRQLLDHGRARGFVAIDDAQGETRIVEYHNTLRVEGVDRPVVRGVARDVTEQSQARAALRHRVDQEQLMVSISTRFIDLDSSEIPAAIEEALAEIGGFLECDRGCFLVLNEAESRFTECLEWRREPAAPQWRDCDEIPRPAELSWLFGRLRQLETIAVERLQDLEAEGRAELAALLGDGARSVLAIPISGRQGLIGVLLLESVGEVRDWDLAHQSLGHIAGHVFGNAIRRAREERQTLRLEREVQQGRKLESLGLVAGGIAHDFNNLLMVILGNAAAALEDVGQDSAEAIALREIETSASRAAELTAQMLAFSGKARLQRGAVDLHGLVATEIAQLRLRAPSAVEFELEGELSILGDEGQMRQVVRNLLDNSLEAVGERQGRVRVCLAERSVAAGDRAPAGVYRPLRQPLRPGRYGSLEVQDDGPGIDIAVLPKVFDPFFSTKFTGRGLGLAAALGIVRGHGGAIEVETGAGGTRIRVLVPLGEVVEMGALAAPQRVADAEAALPGRILLVEPDPATLAALQGLLASAGRDTIRTGSPRHAAEVLAGTQAVAAVIADLTSAETDPELRRLRWEREDLPWVLSGDRPQAEVSERLVALGASGYLPKPFEAGELISLVERVLQEYGLGEA